MIDLQALEKEVPAELHPLLEFFANNFKQICIALAVLVLGAPVFFAIEHFQVKARTETANQLGEILVASQGQDKLDKLEAFLKGAPAELKASALISLTREAMELKAYDRAIQAFEQARDLGDPTLALAAGLGQAQALMLSGKADQALALLEKCVASSDEGYSLALQQSLASAAEAAGALDKALAAYQALLEQSKDQQRQWLESKIATLQSKLESGAGKS